MAVSLRYETQGPVDENVRVKISDETEILQLERNWWTEPIHFFPALSSPGNRMVGFSKVPPFDYEAAHGEVVEIDPDDWEFMSYWDFRFILSLLCKWSSEFGIEWNLSVEGDAAGTIVRGELDRDAAGFLSELALPAQAGADQEADENRAKEIALRYSSMYE